jgi:mannose-6-phosphate isomerase-like protein (cupin superfamily)
MKKSIMIISMMAMLTTACKNGNQEKQETQETPKKEIPMNSNNPTALIGFKTNLEKATLENTDYRKVLYTGQYSQVVLMSLKGGEEIGAETHPQNDQFFRFEVGKGKCIINKTEYLVGSGDAVVAPAGSLHNVINLDPKNELKFYTIYSPPNHRDALEKATKKEADEDGEKFDGKTTE